jgi:hypothetical protein
MTSFRVFGLFLGVFIFNCGVKKMRFFAVTTFDLLLAIFEVIAVRKRLKKDYL